MVFASNYQALILEYNDRSNTQLRTSIGKLFLQEKNDLINIFCSLFGSINLKVTLERHN